MKRWILLLIVLLLSAPKFSPLMMAQTGHYNALSWNWTQGTGDPATGFKIYKASTTGGPYTLLITLTGTTVMTYNDMAVVAGQTNFYVVTSWATGGGESVYSNQVTCTTPFQETPPNNVQGIAH